MKKEDVIIRLTTLQNERQALKDQFIATDNSYHGAIQDCAYWIKAITDQEKINPEITPEEEETTLESYDIPALIPEQIESTTE